jgi:hypothetical protein
MPRGQWDRTLSKEQRAAMKGKATEKAPSVAAKSAPKMTKAGGPYHRFIKATTSEEKTPTSGPGPSIRPTIGDLRDIQAWLGTLMSLKIGFQNHDAPALLFEEIYEALQVGQQIRRSILPRVEPPTMPEASPEAVPTIPAPPVAVQAAPAPAPAPVAVAPAPAPAPVGYTQ